MTFFEDITSRIKEDFWVETNKAINILNDAIKKNDYLKTDRVIRCIIFLANADIDSWNKYIESATLDTRDVMLWAEYEKLNGGSNY